MGKEGEPKSKTREEQEQERIKEILEVGKKLSVISEKAINAGLKPEKFLGMESRVCLCEDRYNCKGRVYSSFDASKDKKEGGINFWSSIDYCRLPEEFKHGTTTNLNEKISLNKNKIVYYIDEGNAGQWGARQQFSFAEGEAKDESSIFEHDLYSDGPKKLSLEEAEKKVHFLLSSFLVQMNDIVQRAKKELG